MVHEKFSRTIFPRSLHFSYELFMDEFHFDEFLCISICSLVYSCMWSMNEEGSEIINNYFNNIFVTTVISFNANGNINTNTKININNLYSDFRCLHFNYFVFNRINIFGFPTRQHFEEFFMSLLLLVNKENDVNMMGKYLKYTAFTLNGILT